ncbi:PAS domain S-box protein [Candidatus Woesearchaeota archaeon]|nr:PAS domain S-box protein [Candidatus Woesearchaeota archaeon]
MNKAKESRKLIEKIDKIKQQNLFDLILRTIPNGVDIVDENLNILFMNKLFTDAFGKKAIGKKCYKIYRDNKKQCELCPLKKPIEVGGTKTLVTSGVAGNRIFEIKHTGMMLPNGKKAVLEIFNDITEKKKAEEEIKKAKAYSENLISSMADGLWVLDVKGNSLDVNQATLNIFGYKSKTVLMKKNPIEVTAKRDLPKTLELIKETFKTGSASGETTGMRKDGKEIPIWIKTSVMKDLQGKITGQFAVISDITEIKKAEEEIKRSEEKFRNLAENLNELVYKSDPKTFTSTYVNPAVKKIYGYTHQEWIKNPKLWENTLHPDDKKRVLAEIGKATKTYLPYEIEYRIIRKDKKIRHVVDRGSWQKDAKGNVISLNGILYDTTEREKVEEALKESEERYRDLFENANDLIQCVDKDGNFVYVNKKWKQILGYSDKELKKIRLMDILRKDQIPHCIKLFKKVSAGQTLENVETVFVTKDGKEVLVRGNVNAHIKNSKFIATRAIFRDVTKQKKAEQEIKKLNEELQLLDRAKNIFLRSNAHELKTPLISAIALSQLLQQEKLGNINKKQKDALKVIVSSAKRLNNSISSIIDLSKLQSGKITSNITDVNLAEIIETEILFVKQIAKEKGAKIRYDIKIPKIIKTDSYWVRQIINNFISNAIKYTKNNISIKAFVKGKDIVVSISDNGSGIAEKDTQKIFDKFYQINKTEKTVKGVKSTGLGLSICKQAIETLGGKIWVKSKLKKGSTFSFSLPIKK